MSALNIMHFEDYFRELHGHAPYCWQQRLAKRAIEGKWPSAIDLPTGTGKTACLDIALFALACQASQAMAERTAPTRIFFCVNRRVIVDEAYRRSRDIAKKIWTADREESQETPILRKVATGLRGLAATTSAHDVPPLDVLELRGGIYRDNRWARSATQPTIVCTTIDQLGSRLLFRGYGVSDNAAPIQAALVAYDSLILLDEAHISRPFLQTIENVRQYLDPEKWAKQSMGVNPVVIVPMTATPPEGVASDDVIHLCKNDRENKSLGDRLKASKPAKLTEVSKIVSATVAAVKDLAKGEPTAIGLIVNRVATARSVYKELRKKHPDAIVELVIGSMRPIDRDKQSERLRELIGPDRPEITTQTSLIVSTQCLEVGADYDFDALVTECASLDALRQRFGRLNRRGRRIDARAVILCEKKSIKQEDKLKDDKPEDPIYGNALARTWNWLSEHGTNEIVDFGVDPFNRLLEQQGEQGRIPGKLLAPSAQLDAPVMMPAYIDLWCQTSPHPTPDPDISLFLHGQQRCEADVQVCWRGDLVDDETMIPNKHWCDVVALLPPTSAECMTVPLSRVRRWLTQATPDGNEGDLLGVTTGEDKKADKKGTLNRVQGKLEHRGVLWRGPKDSEHIESPQGIRPGDTLVIPVAECGWDELGHIPCLIDNSKKEPITTDTDADTKARRSCQIDVAEVAFQAARDHAILRIHPSLLSGSVVDELLQRASDQENPSTPAEWRSLLTVAHDAMPEEATDIKTTLSQLIDKGFTFEPYPDHRGIVLTTRRRLGGRDDWFLPPLDEGDDSSSRTSRSQPISLTLHTRHVVDVLGGSLRSLPLASVANTLRQAASLHDVGKADERFQAMLRRADRTDAWLHAGPTSNLIAKSDGLPTTRWQRRAASQRAGLPSGFRHEMLSVQLTQESPDLPEDPLSRDLVFHLIAAHHGRARPFAPVVIDDDPPDVEVNGMSLTGNLRVVCPPHRIDSGIAERFWSLTRHFGWWGLAYLESLLRLADQQASAAEDSNEPDITPNETNAETPA